MTHKPASPPLLKSLPIFILIISLPLLGCNLIDRIANRGAGEEAMSLDEALEVEAVDGRPTVLEELGPPDAFTVKFQELAGQVVRWETWSYFDFTTLFEFIDGELLWTIELEEVPDGSIYAHFYEPEQFKAGMKVTEIQNLLADQELLEIDLAAIDIEGSLALAGDQILLAFENDRLVYVETVILSPDPNGVPLLDTSPDQIPGAPPVVEDQKQTFLQDQFDTDAPLAIPIAIEEFMTLEHVDGQGKLTSHSAQSLMVAYYEDFTLTDFVLEVDITFQNPGTGAKAGVIFRGDDPQGGLDHYIHIAIAPVEEKLILSVFLEKEWKRWDIIDIPAEFIQADGSYHLGLVCQGEKTVILLEDVQVALLQENDVINPGVFGLSLAAYDVPETVFFDNLVISEHPGQ